MKLGSIEDRIEKLENELERYYEKFTIEIFKELFHRLPSEHELRGWINQFKAHVTTPHHCRVHLKNTPEYHKFSEQKLLSSNEYLESKNRSVQNPLNMTLEENFETIIEKLYDEILQRPPDKPALEYLSMELLLGKLDKKGLEQKLLSSNEYLELKKTHLLPEFKTSYSSTKLEKIIDSVPTWYHTFRFGNIMTQNTRTDNIYQNWISQAIPLNLENKRILDIGTADGYYSFLCEYRGAKKIVAMDISPDLFPGFNAAKKILNSKVEFRALTIERLEQVDEKFDIILFLGVYYHLSNPLLALQKIYNFVTDSVIFSGPILNTDESLMAYYDPFELHPNDDSNWWVASPSCILQSAKRIGFKSATMISSNDIWGNEENNPFLSNDIKNTVRNVNKVGLFKFSK